MTDSTTLQIEVAMSAFGERTPDFLLYLELRQAGFVPTVRTWSYTDKILSVELLFTRDLEQKTLKSTSRQFILWSLAHFWTMGSGFRLACETAGLTDVDLNVNATDTIIFEVECRLLRASSCDLYALTCVENAAADGKRGYAIAMTQDIARAVLFAPAEPLLSIFVRIGDKRWNLLRGYIDQIIPCKVAATGEKLVELRGGDTLTGSRSLISGLYNGLVNFDTSLLFFAMYAEPTLLLGCNHAVPDLPRLDSFLNGELPASRCEEFRKWLRECEQSGGPVGAVATEFLRVVAPEHPMYCTSPFSFKNLAVLAHNHACLWMSIGAVQGLRVEGTLRIGRSVLVCEPAELNIWLKGRPRDELLCRSWGSDVSLLITFFTADTGAETEDRGRQSLQRAFDLLQLTVSDSWFEHTNGSGGHLSLLVDGRLQDAALTLSRWIHVHQIPLGTAHQYFCGRQRSSHRLEITDFQAETIRQRLDILTDLLNVPNLDRPKSYTHVEHAITWFSRSRNSVTHSERFLCLWIGIEFLLIKTDEESGREAIEACVTSRVSRLMGGGDRERKKYWQRKAVEAYRMRCDIVHRAHDDNERIEALLPFLEQAVFEVIWHCTVNGPSHLQFEHPRDVLDATLASQYTS